MNVHYGDVLIKFGEYLDLKKEVLPMISDSSIIGKYKASFLQNGDVIVADTAEDETVGKCSEIAGLTDEIALSGLHTIPYRPMFKFASGFLGYYMNSNSYHSQLLPLMQGIKVTSISKSAMRNTDICYPKTEDEQAEISTFFRTLDYLITLHQRMCVFLGSMVRIRMDSPLAFAWEQRKLTDIVEFFTGLTYTPNDVKDSGTLVLRSSNVSNGEIVDADNVYVNPSVVNSENVKEGDIIVVVRNGSRSLIGKHAQIKHFMPHTVIGAFMTGIRSQCPAFTNALLNTPHFDEEVAMNMGATINQITGYMFSKMEFVVPSFEEQEKIGLYFEHLDNLITLHQREPKHIKNNK